MRISGEYHYRAVVSLVAVALGFFAAGAGAVAAPPDLYRIPDLKALEETFVQAAERVKPSVVSIRTYRYLGLPVEVSPQGAAKAPHSFGSGVVIGSDGFILTNQHVLDGADDIKVVLFNRREYTGQIVQYDLRSDLAVIKIDAKPLRPVVFGSAEDVRVGHWCFVVGNPFGIAYHDGDPAVTFGNIAALGRSLTSELDPTNTRYYGDLIQTSSPINPGNSGGPLFDLDGHMIGIVTAIVSRSGITEGAGFAIPMSERTRPIIDALAARKRVRYGYLGVELPPIDARSSGDQPIHGAVIRGITSDDGPAARAGLQPRDVIVEFAGVAIEDADHLVRVVSMTPVGAQAKVRFVRHGTPREAVVTLAERPLPRQTFQALDDSDLETTRWKGAELAEMTDATLRLHDLSRIQAGLVVIRVDEDSRAHQAGLRPRDIVLRCNGSRVRTLADLARILEGAPHGFKLDLFSGKTIRLPR
ncbi:MAG: PDZ domain-containing protein [bacterium]|nr:PDZ domain-containing protein [bacterium]